MHRPGPELERVTPRYADGLLLRSQPWVSKARQEHDLLCEQLRENGVEVLYVTQLLQDALEYQVAREEVVELAVADAGLGDELRDQLRAHLTDLGPEQLTQVLIAGLTPQELKTGRGVVFELLERHDFVLAPLPNLIFTRDASFWVGDRVAVASLSSAQRRREADLAAVIYRHHPRFTGTKWVYEASLEHVDGGDVLLLAPGVVAVGVGQRTTAAGVERLARRLFDAGLVHAVLAIPIRQLGDGGHLDTLCAVLGTDLVLMHPAIAYSLTAHTISPRADGLRASRPQPFLEAAAQAMDIDRLRVIDSGPGSLSVPSGPADAASNVLAIGRQLVVSHERNSETNARLEQSGVRVIRVPSSELGSFRGGPRCLTCPVGRDAAAQGHDESEPALPVLTMRAEREAATAGLAVPQPAPVPAGLAGLEPAARPARGPAAEPEDAQSRSDEDDDERDQGQPEERLDDGSGHEDHHDHADEQQQQANHVSTVRRPGTRLPARSDHNGSRPPSWRHLRHFRRSRAPKQASVSCPDRPI